MTDGFTRDTALCPWQQPIWEQLMGQWSQQRLPHALLICGPEGIGKRRLVAALAKKLLCQGAQQALDQGGSADPIAPACGRCESCAWFDADSHPDWRYICREEKKRFIVIDQIQKLLHFCGQTAFAGGAKVAVIDPADDMNLNSANALLKTLEEPQPGTFLILISDRPARLLATIRSRCQSVRLELPPPDQGLQWLQTLVGGESLARELLQEAGDRPLKALHLHEQDVLSQWRDCDQALESAISGKTSWTKLAEQWAKRDLHELLDWWIRRFTALAKAQAGGPANLVPVMQHLQAKPATWVLDAADRGMRLLASAEAGSNANPRLSIESLLLQTFGKDSG